MFFPRLIVHMQIKCQTLTGWKEKTDDVTRWWAVASLVVFGHHELAKKMPLAERIRSATGILSGRDLFSGRGTGKHAVAVGTSCHTHCTDSEIRTLMHQH